MDKDLPIFSREADEKIADLQARNDELVEMLEVVEGTATRSPYVSSEGIGIWIVKFSDEGMMNLRALIRENRSK